MNVTREDVMSYSALVGGFFTLAAGFLSDIGFQGTATACFAIAACSVIALLLAYLHTPRS